MYPEKRPWKSFLKRFGYGLLFVLSLFLFPWWATLLFGVVGIFLFGNYYEMVVAGLILDALFLPPGNHGKIFASVIFLLVFILTYWIRTRIRS